MKSIPVWFYFIYIDVTTLNLAFFYVRFSKVEPILIVISFENSTMLFSFHSTLGLFVDYKGLLYVLIMMK